MSDTYEQDRTDWLRRAAKGEATASEWARHELNDAQIETEYHEAKAAEYRRHIAVLESLRYE